MASGALDEDENAHIYNCIDELISSVWEVAKEYTGEGSYGEYPINVKEFGGIYWVQAPEFDDIGLHQ